MKPLTGNDPVGSATHCIDQLTQCVGLQWVIMAHLILFCIYSMQGTILLSACCERACGQLCDTFVPVQEAEMEVMTCGGGLNIVIICRFNNCIMRHRLPLDLKEIWTHYGFATAFGTD